MWSLSTKTLLKIKNQVIEKNSPIADEMTALKTESQPSKKIFATAMKTRIEITDKLFIFEKPWVLYGLRVSLYVCKSE